MVRGRGWGRGLPRSAAPAHFAACKCTYEGRTYGYGEVIYNTTDGLGACLVAICGSNGTITRRAVACPEPPSTTPFTFTSTAAPPSTTGELTWEGGRAQRALGAAVLGARDGPGPAETLGPRDLRHAPPGRG